MDDGPAVSYVVGAASEPFDLLDTAGKSDADVTSLKPGEPFPGVLDKAGGTYKLRQKHGGVIERRGGPQGSEFAVANERSRPLEDNGARVLDAWRATGRPGLTFHVNAQGHAWFLDAANPLFLTTVRAGFAWPSDTTSTLGEEPA
jgi:hypothetical protein